MVRRDTDRAGPSIIWVLAIFCFLLAGPAPAHDMAQMLPIILVIRNKLARLRGEKRKLAAALVSNCIFANDFGCRLLQPLAHCIKYRMKALTVKQLE